MDNNLDIKVVVNCSLCGSKELNVVPSQKNLMQCISCGYSTSDDYRGNKKNNDLFKTLDDNMKRWSKESDGSIWIPSILNFSIGIYYPADVDGEMKWAFAPIEKIPESERDKYPITDGSDNKFYEQKYNTDNQIIFDNFGKGIVEINMIMDIRSKKESSKNVEESI